MIKNLDNDLFSNDEIIFLNENSNNVMLFSNEMGIIRFDSNNISLNDDNFDKDDPETINYLRPVVWCNRDKQCKTRKKRHKQIID